MKKLVVSMMAMTALVLGCPGTSAGEGNEGEGEEGEGEGGGGDATFCQDGCASDAECTTGLVCDSETGTCVAVPQCADDGDCVAALSGWSFTPCSEAAPCPATQVCVDFDGSGAETDAGCATAPSEFFACNMIPGFEDTDVLDIAGDTVTVCANTSGTCEANFCASGDPVEPPEPCAADTDCPAVAGFDRCLSDGTCGCLADEDCADAAFGDVCSDGFCTCANDDACDAGFVCSAGGSYDADDVDAE